MESHEFKYMYYFDFHLTVLTEWRGAADPSGKTGEGLGRPGNARQPQTGHGH
jgi:hypothetical protein